MESARINNLSNRLERTTLRVHKFFEALPVEKWEEVIYSDPEPWTRRGLLAHLVSSENIQLTLARDIVAGGKGAPPDFDYDAFNHAEQEAYRLHAPGELLQLFDQARSATMDWLRGLAEGQLDLRGLHPALGEVSVEEILTAIHGHILLHLKDA
jgi:hypothetical protein